MTTLITNIKNSLLKDAVTKTNSKKLVFIHEDLAHKDQFKLLVPDLDLPENFMLECQPVSLNDLESSSLKLNKILSDAFEASDVYFALESGALGLQILEAAKEFSVDRIKKIYVIQGEKLDEFKACVC